MLATHHAEAPYVAGFQVAHDGKAEDVGDAVLDHVWFVTDVLAAVGEQRQPLLLAEHGVELGRSIACRIESADNGADAGACDVVDGYSRLLDDLQNAHLGSPFGTAST